MFFLMGALIVFWLTIVVLMAAAKICDECSST
jgi:hypothetical protein